MTSRAQAMARARRRGWLVLAALALVSCGDAARAPFAPRLVLLYAPCTVSKSFLAPYRAQVQFTPHLARFAEDALVFESHLTEAGSSGIAYASLFSGVQADRHGVFQHPKRLPDALLLITEAFGQHGYETFFWGAHGMASRALAYDQGVSAANSTPRPLRADDEGFRRLLQGLGSDPARRALVVTNFTVTHGPYPGAALRRFLRDHPERARHLSRAEIERFVPVYRQNHLALAYNFDETIRRLGLGPAEVEKLVAVVELLYASNISALDGLFGGVLRALDASGLRDESLVAFTADHGEILFRENALFHWTHSSSLAPEVIEVPLIVSAPGHRELRVGRYSAVTRSIDVLPTLLGLAGLPPAEAEIEGRDLSPAITGRAKAPELTAYSHTAIIPRVVHERMQAPGGAAIWGLRMRLFPRPDPRLMWVSLRHANRSFTLQREGAEWTVRGYDSSRDPSETRDLFDPADPAHAAAGAALRRYRARLVASAEALEARGTSGFPARSEEEAALEALGYLP